MRAEQRLKKISVGNVLLQMLPPKMRLPTFVIDTVGMTRTTLETEVARLGCLQTIAPVFRVVVLADRQVFAGVRRFGWPVEQLPTPEGAAQDRSLRDSDYTRARMAIISKHYDRATLVRASPELTIAARIAELVGMPELSEAVDRVMGPAESGPARLDWAKVTEDLNSTGSARFEADMGSVVLSAFGPQAGRLLVRGRSAMDAWESPATCPSDVLCVDAEFGLGSSESFEAMVYVRLCEAFGSIVAVVQPWRKESVMSATAERWIDLAISRGQSELSVLPQYRENYRILASSEVLDWSAARTYAAVRRVARSVRATD